jgi:hypothetical protein
MKSKKKAVAPNTVKQPVVIRSMVPAGRPYHEYAEMLRDDFLYSCAYCTIAETEALGIGFSIDHYDPRNARPDLVNEYSNLMHSCDLCNRRKGDLFPPVAARQNGYRFFRPDQDIHGEHFRLEGERIEAETNVGSYSILALGLNRLIMRRVLKLRHRLSQCDRMVAEGIAGLRDFHIDQLPPRIKGPADRAIKAATGTGTTLADRVDLILKRYARSPLLDEDPEAAAHAKEQTAKMADLKVLFPGSWRAPRARRR